MTKKKIKAIRDFIISAEKSVRSAKKILKELLDEEHIDLNEEMKLDTKWLNAYDSWDSKIVEWVFSWSEMFWADKGKYPVPVNYASKSKLVQWDKLKLTILENWKMLYKQIEPIERETKVWLLTKDKWNFQVVADGVSYNVLTAAVTHFKWEVWDSLTILVPKWKDATFAAIEAVIPK